MTEVTLESIILSQGRFRMTLWHPHIRGISADVLMRVSIAQIRKDANNEEKSFSTVRRGDTIGLIEADGKSFRVSYYSFLGVKESTDGTFVARLRAGDGGNLDRLFQFRLNDVSFLKSRKLPTNRLTRRDGRYSQRLVSTVDPCRFVRNRIDQGADVFCRVVKDDDRLRLQFLNRTRIILVSRKNTDDLTEELRSSNGDGACLLDCFQMAVKQNSNDKSGYPVNSLPYQHVARDFDILLFSRLSAALDFIAGSQGEEFLVLTDQYTQVYNPAVWQRLNALENFSLIHLADVDDFRRLGQHDGLILKQSSIQPIILSHTLPSKKNLQGRIFPINDDELESLLQAIRLRAKGFQRVYPESATRCFRLMFSVCKMLTLGHSDIEDISAMARDIQLEMDKQVLSKLLERNPKFGAINKLALQLKIGLVTDNPTRIQLDRFDKKENVSLCHSKEIEQSGEKGVALVVFWADKWFLLNTLFPHLLLRRLNLDLTNFVLYPTEVRFLFGVFDQFRKTIEVFIKNGHNLEGSEFKGYDDVKVDAEIPDITFNFDNYSKRFYPSEDQTGIETVKVRTLGLTDGENEYLVFLTDHFKPYVIIEDQVTRQDFDSLAIDETVVFFEGEGERGILESYKDTLFSTDSRHIENVKRWKKYLADHVSFNGQELHRIRLEKFIIEMGKRGLYRDSGDIMRWLDPETIGTQNPREDFKIIAAAIGDTTFISESDTIADSCAYLQSKCKRVGKILKRLALQDFKGARAEASSNELTVALENQLDRIVQRIKTLRIRYIDDNEKRVNKADANILIQVTGAQVNSTIS